MPISNKHKLIFIHIPKNAGTAFCKTLDMKAGHSKWNFYKKSNSLAWKNYKKIAIVRNPFDRVVSNYEYAKMKTSYWHSVEKKSIYGKHKDYNLLKDKSFKETLRILKNSPQKLKHQGWSPQHIYICNPLGTLMVDKLFRYESLNEDFNDFFDDVKLMKINVSKKDKNYRDYYDKETINIVREFYKKDFKLFNYNQKLGK